MSKSFMGFIWNKGWRWIRNYAKKKHIAVVGDTSFLGDEVTHWTFFTSSAAADCYASIRMRQEYTAEESPLESSQRAQRKCCLRPEGLSQIEESAGAGWVKSRLPDKGEVFVQITQLPSSPSPFLPSAFLSLPSNNDLLSKHCKLFSGPVRNLEIGMLLLRCLWSSGWIRNIKCN